MKPTNTRSKNTKQVRVIWLVFVKDDKLLGRVRSQDTDKGAIWPLNLLFKQAYLQLITVSQKKFAWYCSAHGTQKTVQCTQKGSSNHQCYGTKKSAFFSTQLLALWHIAIAVKQPTLR